MATWNKTELSDLHVLVVDDEAIIVKTVEAVLREIGITHIYKAADGAQALDHFEGGVRVIDIIVLDWMMPGMDGIQFVTRARGMGVTAPVIMLTSKKESDDIVEARDAGNSAYVAKPFSAIQLKEKLERVAKAVLAKKAEDAGA